MSQDLREILLRVPTAAPATPPQAPGSVFVLGPPGAAFWCEPEPPPSGSALVVLMRSLEGALVG